MVQFVHESKTVSPTVLFHSEENQKAEGAEVQQELQVSFMKKIFEGMNEPEKCRVSPLVAAAFAKESGCGTAALLELLRASAVACDTRCFSLDGVNSRKQKLQTA